MRKHGRLFIVALLLLLAPSLASAWILQYQGQGSSDGSATIYFQDATTNVVLDPLNAATYVKALKGGQTVVSLSGQAKATVILATNIAATVTIDGVASSQTASSAEYVIATPAAREEVKMTAAWGQAASAKGNVSIVKTIGGSTLVQYGTVSTMTGYNGLAFGTSVNVKATPNTDYRVTSITVTDVAAGQGTPYPFTGGAGEAKIQALTIASTSYSVSANYAMVANAKAQFAAPLKAIVGKEVTLSAVGSTSNDSSATYEFVVGGVVGQNTTVKTYTFTPTVAGTLAVVMNIKKDSTVLASKTASIQVVTESSVYNNLCLGCHTGSTPQVITDFNVSKYKNLACTDCHTSQPHYDPTSYTNEVHHINEVSCADCHVGTHPQMVRSETDRNNSCGSCHGDLTAVQIKASPFKDEITARFNTGRHVGNARNGNCAACHSHEGALVMFSKDEKFNTIAQIEGISAELAALGAVANLDKKNCATCHNPHDGTLRGVGDVKETFTLASNSTSVRTVYSSEFNLCTSCHQVSLETAWNANGGYSNAGVINYALADIYTKSESNPDPYTENKGIGYHTNSYQARSFVDTHFKGELYKKFYYYDVSSGYSKGKLASDGTPVLDAALNFPGNIITDPVTNPTEYAKLVALYNVYLDETGPDNITIAGYNVNPGSATACSSCHDVHAANKPVKAFTSPFPYAKNFEVEVDKAIKYGEGIGATHGNYTGNPFARNVSGTNGNMYASAGCTPCHVGRDYVKMTVGATKTELGAAAWNPVSCVSCHDTAQNGVAPTTVRTMPEGYVFSFPATGSVSPTAADLGSSQICFECHKGRTPAGVNVSSLTAGPTNHYDISYLHYSPTFAIYYGNDAKMAATYADKTYRGKSTTHSANAANDAGGGLTYGVVGGARCLDCHDVHSGIRVSNPNIRNGQECATCHDSDAKVWHDAGRIGPMPEGNKFDQRTSKGDVSTTATRLVDTIYARMMATTNIGFNTNLTAFLTSLHAQTDAAQGKEMVKLRIKERSLPGGWPTKEIAHACASWKVFYYEDKASFAHNRNFARQVMFDAIQSLGGDTTGIPTRPL